MLTLLFLLSSADAAGIEQQLAWDVTLDGKPIGQRTLTVKYINLEGGQLKRIIECWTEIDATIIGFEYLFRERLTAHVGGEAASFHAVVEDAGSAREVQARRNDMTWTVTVAEHGREYTREIPSTSIDLSTADLLDPDSRVFLTRYTTAKVLSAETGDIWEGPVERIGPGEVVIDGEGVPVDGVRWTPSEGIATFFYTSDGFLVQYQVKVMGRTLIGTLSDPPPSGVDDAPVTPVTGVIGEVQL
jgi:hypothetical protein